ncbi:hypothetical protein KY334_00390 [Candidatus Woesearchaeota archaeon]|nr:hypothetical protein [Candidatus Woesearchaeota archaeon]
MNEFTDALSKIAPIYNIMLSFVVFYMLYILILGKTRKTKSYLKPWKYFYVAITLFIIEEIITLLKFFKILSDATIPRTFNASIELIIIILFVFMLKLEIMHIEDEQKDNTKETVVKKIVKKSSKKKK